VQNQVGYLPPVTNPMIRECLMYPRKTELHPAWGVTNAYIALTGHGKAVRRSFIASSVIGSLFWPLYLLIIFGGPFFLPEQWQSAIEANFGLFFIGFWILSSIPSVFIDLHGKGGGKSAIIETGAWEICSGKVTDKQVMYKGAGRGADAAEMLDTTSSGAGGLGSRSRGGGHYLYFNGFTRPVKVHPRVYDETQPGRPVYLVYGEGGVYAFFFADRFGGYFDDGQKAAQ